MALRLGYTPGDWRRSYWIEDDAVDWEATPDESRADFLLDGDASHLVLRAQNGTTFVPTEIRFRALTAEELATIRGLVVDWQRQPDESDEQYALRVAGGANVDRMQYFAFRVGVEIPSVADCKKIRERGLYMMPARAVDALMHNYRGIIAFYGRLVLAASLLGQPEKSAPASDVEPGRVVDRQP